jgi:cytochrome c biogenesis protein
VSVELGGLARTDNSGWGDEFERLTERLLAGSGEARREEREMKTEREAEAGSRMNQADRA